jgi:hypothetical protein
MDAVIIITVLFLLQDVKLFYSLIIVAFVGLLASLITTIYREPDGI